MRLRCPDGDCFGLHDPGPPFALAGRYVAYEQAFYNPDTDDRLQFIVVTDLKRGRIKRRRGPVFDPTSPDSGRATVERIVLKRNGSVAWLARGFSAKRDRMTREVYRLDRRGYRRLDEGPTIKRRSLRLHCRRLSWIHAGHKRTATLY